MVHPETPDTLDDDELRLITDDPLVLDARDDGHVVIPRLPASTFVRIARRLRDEERLELLLPFATTEQLTSLLDLDGWSEDRLDVARGRTWLHAIAELAPANKPRGALADLIYEMDPELWTLALAAGTVVAQLPDDDDEARDRITYDLAALRTYETPDGFFLVGVPDGELGLRALAILRLIYEDDLAEGRKLCMAMRALLPSQAEEDLLRWRNGRLADLGFVHWEQAIKLLRPLDHRTAAQHDALNFDYLRQHEGLEPTVSWRGPDLLRRVMMQLPPAEHGVRSREFLLLVNEVMSAQRFDPGDETQQQRAIDQTQSTISLGLELLGSQAPAGEEAEAFLAERVRAIGLRLLFRVGYGALDKVRTTALLLHREGRISLKSPGSLLDRPWGPAIAAFAGLYPELPRNDGKGTRPLRGLPDVAQATLRVAQAAALARLAFDPEGYGIDPVWIDRTDEPARLRIGDLIRTAIVHARLPGASPSLAPLTPDDLAWARDHLVEGGELVDPVRRGFAQRCAALGIGEHQQILAENLLVRLKVELMGLEADADGRPDLRRTGGLLTVQQVGLWLRLRHGDGNN